MPLNTNGRNAMLTGGLGNAVTHVSAHTAVPNTSGSNEATGGSYARQPVTWNTVASGQRTNNGAISIPVPAGTYGYVGLWNALTVGTFYGWLPFNSSTMYGFGTVDSAGVTGNLIQSAAHGLVNNDRVLLFNVFAESLPTGVSEDTEYFVVGSTTNTFQVSATSGGAAIDITAQGELFFMKVVPEVFASAGSISIADTALVLDANAI